MSNMSDILIFGAGGMVGQKLVNRIRTDGIAGDNGHTLTLHDIAFPASGQNIGRQVVGDITDAGQIRSLVADRPAIIFNLASIVSGEAEENFPKGWDINMFSMWHLLQAIRDEHLASGGSYSPRLVFTSSIAVFGGPYPDAIDDEFLAAPQTSYGAQKLTCETLLSDFSRKGYVDGISLRLPTICVRPGKPNKAASGFFSGIIREPLNGQTAILPVEDTVRHWHASPRSAAGFLTHAATLDTALLNNRRALNLPGLSCTVAEQIEALRDIAGQDAVSRIAYIPNPDIQKIVAGWPRNFNPERSLALGFRAENSFREIIETYIAEDFNKADGITM